MAGDIQLMAILGAGADEFGVVVDGRWVGRAKRAGNDVIWRPWYMAGTVKMGWGAFVGMFRR